MHAQLDKLDSSHSPLDVNRSIVLRVIAIFLTGLVLGVGGTLVYRSYADTDRSGPVGGEPSAAAGELTSSSGLQPRRSVIALGTLEPRDGIVQVSSALVGYQVKQVRVHDGQLVEPGDVLVELDARAAEAEREVSLSQLAEALERQQTELALAKQRVASADLAVKQAIDGRQLELDSQQARIAVAAAKKKQAQNDVERAIALRKLPEPLTSDQQVEQQSLVLEGSAAELEGAQVALKRLEQALTFQQQTATAELRAAQQSLAVAEKGTGVESLKRRVDLAELKLKQTNVTAPAAGVVLGVMTHAGEVVAQQPLLQIADLDNLICEAEVDAGDVPYLQANQKATVSCRAFQDSALDGTVDRVGNQVMQVTLRPLDPRKPVDRDVTKVVVLIDSAKAARLINISGKDRRAALVGLQVEVAFPLAKAAP